MPDTPAPGIDFPPGPPWLPPAQPGDVPGPVYNPVWHPPIYTPGGEMTPAHPDYGRTPPPFRPPPPSPADPDFGPRYEYSPGGGYFPPVLSGGRVTRVTRVREKKFVVIGGIRYQIARPGEFVIEGTGGFSEGVVPSPLGPGPHPPKPIYERPRRQLSGQLIDSRVPGQWPGQGALGIPGFGGTRGIDAALPRSRRQRGTSGSKPLIRAKGPSWPAPEVRFPRGVPVPPAGPVPRTPFPVPQVPPNVPKVFERGSEPLRGLPDPFEILREQRRRVIERPAPIDPIPLPELEPQRTTPRPGTPVRTIPDPVFPEYPAPSVEPAPVKEPPPVYLPPPAPPTTRPPTRQPQRTTAPAPGRVTIPGPLRTVNWPGIIAIPVQRRQRQRDTSPIPRVAPPAQPIGDVNPIEDLTPLGQGALPFAQPLASRVRTRDKEEECKCDEEEPKERRPSRVVAAVRAFRRRMSQNSLDNLR